MVESIIVALSVLFIGCLLIIISFKLQSRQQEKEFKQMRKLIARCYTDILDKLEDGDNNDKPES